MFCIGFKSRSSNIIYFICISVNYDSTMKRSTSNREANSIDISPISRHSRLQLTSLKTKRKTSRNDQSTDIHAACSTPNRSQSGTQCNGWNSPSDSFPYSQEGRPDVIWDYTSPKLPKGCKRKEIKITVDEFLKNLTHHQVPDCNTQTSNYIKLLEKWMTKQNSPVCIKKPLKNVKIDNKKRSRRVIEEIKEFLESIQEKNESTSVENKKECTAGSISLNPESSSLGNVTFNKKSFLEGDDSKNDSTDELWGDMDNSFMVKATQHLDVSYSNVPDKNLDIMPTIPETIPSTPQEPSYNVCETKPNEELQSLNNTSSDSDQQAQLLLTQIINCDWDSGSDDDWDNGFIAEDDALSLIPDEVLCGSDPQQEVLNKTVVNLSHEAQSSIYVQSVKSSSDNTAGKNSEEISFGCSESNRVASQTVDASDAELFNNFEDESFGDESLLCKPEVLSWIDEVESKLSQSQRCTPEEIEKKKDEAVARRKKGQSKSKHS